MELNAPIEKPTRTGRAAEVSKVVLNTVQAIAIVVAGFWTYNKWIKVEEPDRQWIQLQRNAAQIVTGKVDVCISAVTRVGDVTVISMDLFVVNTGKVHFGVDVIELSADWAEPRNSGHSIVRPEYEQMYLDTLFGSDELAPTGILAPGDSAHGTADLAFQPMPSRVYRLHAQLRLKPVVVTDTSAVIARDLTGAKPWHAWARWSEQEEPTCPTG